MPLTARAQEFLAFITLSGLISYEVMSFGLRNAPATFQQLMNRVISGLSGCAVLDNVVVSSSMWDKFYVGQIKRIRAGRQTDQALQGRQSSG